MKIIKNFSTYIKENYEDIPMSDSFEITIDMVPYTVKRIPSNSNPTFEMKNMLGMEGSEHAQRKNGACGVVDKSFEVCVTPDTIQIELFSSFVDGFSEIQFALSEAVKIITDKYNSIGWEMLQ
jgi:hypothetical protein